MCTSSGLTLTCRVQYVDDIEPFPLGGVATAVPTRAPLHSFSRQLPLGEQVAAVASVLRAPHRVRTYTYSLYHTTRSPAQFTNQFSNVISFTSKRKILFSVCFDRVV